MAPRRGEREREKSLYMYFFSTQLRRESPPTHVESEIKYDFMFVRYYDISP